MNALVSSFVLLAAMAGAAAAETVRQPNIAPEGSNVAVDGRQLPVIAPPQREQPPSETQARRMIVADVRQAFLMRDFNRLNETLELYRSRQERTGSGIWKLAIAYSAIEETLSPSSERDELYHVGLERSLAGWLSLDGPAPGAHIAHVMSLYSRAWRARGSGYANSVTEAGWREYLHYLSLARIHLEENRLRMFQDPHWHTLRIRIALEQQNPTDNVGEFLDEAIAQAPEYHQTYFEVARMLQPQWGGSPEKVVDFAEYVAERTRETMGQAMFARITWHSYEAINGSRMLARKEIDWAKLKVAFEDLVARHPDPFNKNRFANMACAAEDRETTRRLFIQVERDLIPAAWSHMGMISRCNLFQALGTDGVQHGGLQGVQSPSR